MFRHIVAFEWRYQVRSPVFWVGALIFLLLAFLSVASDNVHFGTLGNAHRNAPFAIMQTLGWLSVFAIFITVSMVANVVVRDDDTHFAPIIRSTSIGKASYLGGRFVGACAAAFAVLAVVPLGLWLGSLAPWVDTEKLGPTLSGDYLFALFAHGLPTLLITGALCFAIATATRSLLWSNVCAVGLLVLFFAARGATRNDPVWEHVAAILDPFGLCPLGFFTKYWTTAERNTFLPPVAGVILTNRLVWMAIAGVVFAVAYRRFRFETSFEAPAAGAVESEGPAKPVKLSRAQKAAIRHQDELAALGENNPAGVREMLAAANRKTSAVLPDIPPATRATARMQLWELAKVDMAFVFRSPAYYVLIAIGLLLAWLNVAFGGEILGSPSYPVTRVMVEALLNGNFASLPIILAIFYAGELVWRDRDRRMHEIIDATAAPDWTHVIPKIVAIAVVLLSSTLIAVLAAIAFQALSGFFRFEVGAYVAWFIWPMSVGAVLLAVLSVFVQVLAPHKYIGWAVMLVFIVASGVMYTLGFEHNLYNYASTPPLPLSDMNGLGRFWIAQAWFQLYWSAFATILLVFAHLLWRRGTTVALRPRLRQAARRLRGPAGATLAVATAIWVATGGWIFYNTNVLNRYVTQDEHDQLMADLEKALLPLEKTVQPRVTDVKLDVALFPREARAVTHGTFMLVNRSAQTIPELHLQWAENLKLDSISLPGATLVDDKYARFHYRIYKLATPLQPGEQRSIGFTTTLQERGFANGRPLTAVVPNGSFIDNLELTPAIGFVRNGLLEDRAKRRKYGLPPELRPPKLEDESARQFNALSRDSDWVSADITITTDGDQTPIAPGRTLSDTGASTDPNARRTVHFRSDAPINQIFSIQSGRYAIKRDVWHAPAMGGQPAHDVDLAVYYAPEHEYNVGRMLDAMRESLGLFSREFTPYQFQQARIVEFPAYANLAASFANTIPFSEGIGFIQHPKPTGIDVATYVTAHEIAHQWWGHQLVPADQQGAPMLTETFAQYSALLVMEQHYGKEHVRRFLKYELDRYLRSRGGQPIDELPLNRVENQDYIYYRKGSVAMYSAKEVLGEEVLDRAMRKLLAQYAFKGAPYANTTDFLQLLRAEAGPRNEQTIHDLFEQITLLDLKASDAVTTKLPSGKYSVTFNVEARKYDVDAHGAETEVPMDEAVQIGVFSAEPGSKGFDASNVLLLTQVPIKHGVAPAVAEVPAGAGGRRWISPLFTEHRSAPGTTPITVEVAAMPTWVGIDPYNERIDRNADDNLTRVDRPR